MAKKETKLQQAQKNAEDAIKETNEKIEQLGKETSKIHYELNNVQAIFDLIRNVPSDKYLQLEELKNVRLDWKDQVEKIESDYKVAAAKGAGVGAAGAGAGVAVAALGPTAAMGLATTFGVASTGTAISTLTGAAATNAALAWLGGGALTAGGGGMVAGNVLLALAGPIGWGIAGVALLGGGTLFWKAKNDKERLENIFTLISERDVKSYELSIVELNERIRRIKDETTKLHDAVNEVKTFGIDYNQMSENQQYKLGSYVNLMNSSTQLLVNPILGLQPKYSEEDFEAYLLANKNVLGEVEATYRGEIIVSLSNLLYKIELSKKDKEIFWKTIKKNKQFLSSMKVSKKNFELAIMDNVSDALESHYLLTKY